MSSPFEEDSEVGWLLERFDFALDRRESIEIEDPKALEELGLMRKCPDYGKIRRIIRDGGVIPGVRMRGIEYILRKQSEPNETSKDNTGDSEGSQD